MLSTLNEHDYLVSALEAVGRAGPPEFNFAMGLSWCTVGPDTVWPEDIVCGTARSEEFPPGTALLTLVTETDSVLLTPRIMQALNREKSRLGGVFPALFQPVAGDELFLDRPVEAVQLTVVLRMSPQEAAPSFPAMTQSTVLATDLISPLILLTVGQVAGCPR